MSDKEEAKKNEQQSSNGPLNTLTAMQQSSNMRLPLWAILLICIGGTALVTTGLFLLMHLIGKKIREKRAQNEVKQLLKENKMFF